MRLVLVGDDGSDVAGVAVDWAARFALERDAQLFAVHVPAPGEDVEAPSRVEHVIVREGHPAAAIMEAAHDLDADVIVLGRRGRGGFPSLPIGAIAHHVAAVSARPVVVIPARELSSHQPLVRQVVVGLDGMPETADAAAWAAQNFDDAHFIAVHALELAPAFAQSDGEPNANDLYDRARARAVDLMRDHWCRPFVDAEVPFGTVVEEGGAAEVLIGTAARTAADVVVVSRRDRHLRRGTLGGVSQRVLAYAPCPVAMIPSPA
jgi:nucleotide-binding universal stress UspA family protein